MPVHEVHEMALEWIEQEWTEVVSFGDGETEKVRNVEAKASLAQLDLGRWPVVEGVVMFLADEGEGYDKWGAGLLFMTEVQHEVKYVGSFRTQDRAKAGVAAAVERVASAPEGVVTLAEDDFGAVTTLSLVAPCDHCGGRSLAHPYVEQEFLTRA